MYKFVGFYLNTKASFDVQVAYTFDAGPNAVLIARNRKAATLLIQRLLYYFPPNSDDLDRCFLSFSIFMHTILRFLSIS
jgi:hypothetical protein